MNYRFLIKRKAFLTIFAILASNAIFAQSEVPEFNKAWALANAHIKKQDSLIYDMQLRTSAFHRQTISGYRSHLFGLGLIAAGLLTRSALGNDGNIGKNVSSVLYGAGGTCIIIGSITIADAHKWLNQDRRNLNLVKGEVKVDLPLGTK